MKILVLNGSPKEESTTMLLTHSFIAGLEQSDKQEVKIVSSYKKNIKYCMGDLSCWFQKDNRCIIQDDDMAELLQDMMDADMILWSFPLHCHGIPASLKAILDRTIVFLNINMVETDLGVDHEKSFDLSAKKNVFIIGGGYPLYADNFASVKLQLQTYFKNPAILCVCETALLGVPVPELTPLKENLFAQFKQAGQMYASNGSIPDALIHMIEQPIIPNDAYINIINHSGASQ